MRRYVGKCCVGLLLVMLLGIGSLTGLAAEPIHLGYAAGSTNHPDPHTGAGAVDCTVYANVYDTLLYPTSEGDLKEHMAKSWTQSDDGLVYTFALRQGIPFHDGTEVKAEDVVFSAKRLMAINRGFSYLFNGIVEEVQALDDYTIQFTLFDPYPLFKWSIVRLYIMNKNYVMSKIKDGEYGEYGDYGVGYFSASGDDAGSGPYKLVDYIAGEKTVMNKFEEYSLDGGFVQNAPDVVTCFMVIDAVALKAMFKNKELDIASQWMPKEWNDSASAMEGAALGGLSVTTSFQLQLNVLKPPLDDIHVRRALAYTLDYDTVMNNIYTLSERAIGPVPKYFAGHNPDLYVYEMDMDKAREELAKSKYFGEFDKYPMTYRYVETVADEEKIGLLLKAAAAELGLTINIVRSPWVSIVDEAASIEGTAHIYAMFTSSDIPEAVSMLYLRYHSATTGRWSQTEWLMNPGIDAMIDDAFRTVDDEIRWEKSRAIQSRIVELCATIHVFDSFEPRSYQEAYLDWPFIDNPIPVLGYNFAARFISVDVEAKAALQR